MYLASSKLSHRVTPRPRDSVHTYISIDARTNKRPSRLVAEAHDYRFYRCGGRKARSIIMEERFVLSPLSRVTRVRSDRILRISRCSLPGQLRIGSMSDERGAAALSFPPVNFYNLTTRARCARAKVNKSRNSFVPIKKKINEIITSYIDQKITPLKL